MAANTRFAVAIHAMGMLAYGDEMPVTSNFIAHSVNTNPVVVRRIMAQLTKHGLVEAKLGAGGGSRLTRSPESITLADIYLALEEGSLFQIPFLSETHDCPVGRNVGPVLNRVLMGAEKGLLAILRAITLAEVIGKIMRRVKKECCAQKLSKQPRKKK